MSRIDITYLTYDLDSVLNRLTLFVADGMDKDETDFEQVQDKARDAMMTAGQNILSPYRLKFVDSHGEIEGDYDLDYNSHELAKVIRDLDEHLIEKAIELLD